MADVLHVGDIGSIIRVTVTEAGVALDISSATTKQIKLMRPDGTSVTKTAVFTTDGTDGQLQYATMANDLNLSGLWWAQPYLVMPAWSGHAQPVQFEVDPIIVGV